MVITVIRVAAAPMGDTNATVLLIRVEEWPAVIADGRCRGSRPFLVG
jgi:hypothetical protein